MQDSILQTKAAGLRPACDGWEAGQKSKSHSVSILRDVVYQVKGVAVFLLSASLGFGGDERRI
jgi:hypothetical protein